MLSVMKYFEYASAAEFRKDWMKLTAEDKKQLIDGIANETYNY